MLTNMTASTSAIDPRMAWYNEIYFDTPMFVPPNEENSHPTTKMTSQEPCPSELYSPLTSTMQTQSTPNTNERLPYPMPFDWTPEGKTFNSPLSWETNQTTPTRSSSKSRHSLSLLCDTAGQNLPSNSPQSAIGFQSNSMPLLSPTTSNSIVAAYAPRRASGPATFGGSNNEQSQTSFVSPKLHEDHQRAIKSTESCRMPPPPVPKRALQKSQLPNVKQHRLSEELYAKLAGQNNNQFAPLFEGRNQYQTNSNTLPPQYRALYNASIVGPTQYACEDSNGKKEKGSSLSQKLLLKVLFSNKIVKNIASKLTETDALSFALSSSSIYHRLDDDWWKEVHPVRSEEQSKKSAWVYLWPDSHGWCSYCTKWERIVMHEPSKAHVCFECMQLPQFKVISFSAARSLFKLGNPIALNCFSQLPSVQDGKARYFWVCHLLWVQAQCRITDAAIELIRNKPIMCKTNKERLSSKRKRVAVRKIAKRRRKLSPKSSTKQDEVKIGHSDTGFPNPQSDPTDVSVEPPQDESNVTFYDDESSDLTSFGDSDEEDAEGITDDEYVPNARSDKRMSNGKNEKRANSPSENGMARHTRSRTYTGASAKRERKSSATFQNRRTRSSPAPNAIDRDKTRADEDGEQGVAGYICTSSERTMSIVREVRREYIVKELESMGKSINDAVEVPQMFINGQWDMMEKIGIQHNDWNAMAKWVINNEYVGSDTCEREY